MNYFLQQLTKGNVFERWLSCAKHIGAARLPMFLNSITTLRVVEEEFFCVQAKTQAGGGDAKKAKKLSQTELDSHWILQQLSSAGSTVSMTELKALYTEKENIAEDTVYQRLRRAYLSLECQNKITVTKTENETLIQICDIFCQAMK